jgi:hypothetical protein
MNLAWPSSAVRITALDIGPNVCGLFEPLVLQASYQLDESVGSLEAACWEFTFLFDVVFERQELGASRRLLRAVDT